MNARRTAVLFCVIGVIMMLALAECHTDRIVGHALSQPVEARVMLSVLPTTECEALADYLNLPLGQGVLSHWCRVAAARLLEETASTLGMVVCNDIMPGGVQVLVALASPYGVSITQRSFGGHPENINQWAFTLALAHLRRWLLVHA